MKIGILTWFCGMNYGAQAQTYALRKFLERMGYECEEIAYYPQAFTEKNIKMNLNIEPNWYVHPKQIYGSLRRLVAFSKFIQMQDKGAKIKNISEVSRNNYSLIVIGSDEVVNCNHPFHDNAYFGVGINNIPLMYYAPSCGALDVDYKLSEKICLSLKNFIGLSGRDINTCKFLSVNSQREVTQVLDPTFLYDFDDIVCDVKYSKYILLYSFDSLDSYKNVIKNYANVHSLKIVSLGRYCKWADYCEAYASVEMWVSLFRDAELVVTDSFHGVVFSIKNENDFIILGRGDKLNKINSLLSELSINRAYLKQNEEIEQYLTTYPIDYNIVRLELCKKKNVSINYIKHCLEKLL